MNSSRISDMIDLELSVHSFHQYSKFCIITNMNDPFFMFHLFHFFKNPRVFFPGEDPNNFYDKEKIFVVGTVGRHFRSGTKAALNISFERSPHTDPSWNIEEDNGICTLHEFLGNTINDPFLFFHEFFLS